MLPNPDNGRRDGGDNPNPPPPIKKKQITEIFFNKMYHDELGNVNVVETVDTLSNTLVPTRTIYDANTFVNYDIFYLEERRCHVYHLRPNHQINFRYVQDLFLNNRNFFDATGGKDKNGAKDEVLLNFQISNFDSLTIC